ncbi:hypothetical protein GCM10025862_19200 [Arsenicicoccus piscis]|uniref:Uncharacterized protein n=1 Tax=Arsenicicoccus piscis TaxID=673954 RepID=A0ABQ6HN75_9MICO|nr:hypothetical protein GCM10025862_19200 [Arsenicicoccus piscis]
MTARPAETAAWARHQQVMWEERAGDRNLPLWLRVASLAMGKHDDHGHAHFRRGQVALVLATVPPSGGEIAPLDRRQVHRAIFKAVEYGWLAPGSNTQCLRVPDGIVGGWPGSGRAGCPVTKRRHSETTKRGQAA